MTLRKDEERKRHRRSLIQCIVLMVAMLLLLGIAGNEDVKSRTQNPVLGVAPIPALTDAEKKIATVLYSAGSPHAEPLARAIAKTRRPRLVTGVILQESRGDITAVGLAGELGCGQVLEKHWGSVPKDAAGQVKQVEAILEELLQASRGRISVALSKYNGDRSGTYSRQVIQKIAMVKL